MPVKFINSRHYVHACMTEDDSLTRNLISLKFISVKSFNAVCLYNKNILFINWQQVSFLVLLFHEVACGESPLQGFLPQHSYPERLL